MEKETILSLHALELCKTKDELVKYLIIQFKENGSLYFEHGYSEPSFIINGFGYVTLYAITSNDNVKVKFSIPNAKTGNGEVNLEELTFAQLKRLVYVCNDYYLYCKYEA